MAEQRFPLANDIDGNPLAVPEAAVAWLVRRRAGRGRPQVSDPATGAQLELGVEPASVRSRCARITTRLRSDVAKGSAA